REDGGAVARSRAVGPFPESDADGIFVVEARAVIVPPVLPRVAHPLLPPLPVELFDAQPLLPAPADVELDAQPLFPPPAELELAVAHPWPPAPPELLNSPPSCQPPVPPADEVWLLTVSRTLRAVVALLLAVPLSAPWTPIAAFMSIIDCARAGAAATS